MIKENKKKCWQEYRSKINTSTKPKTIWKMVRKISRKHPPIKHFIIKSSKIIEKKAIANKLGKTFSDNSSSKHYSKQFQVIKKNKEKYKINLNSKDQEVYNEFFSMTELKTAIEKSHNSAVRPDEVHHSFLKQIPQKSLELLLKIYNDIWTGKQFLKSWKQATIIPLPKSEKNTSYPENYRPNTLTSCLCITLDRMVNHHLV